MRWGLARRLAVVADEVWVWGRSVEYFSGQDKIRFVVGLVQVALDPTVGPARAEVEEAVATLLSSVDPTDLDWVS